MTASSSLGRTLRIGVTGKRDLLPAQIPRLRSEVTALLQEVIAHARSHQEEPSCLQLLSPLAEGADRLVAECALELGFRLVCPLPFAQDDYELDFKEPDSLGQFRALLDRADGRVLALDGARGDDEAQSYVAVGRLIVRNCDILIGIWDGRPGAGPGGTADTIRYAANFGPPVVWLHAADPTASPRWIEEMHDLRRGAPPREVGPRLQIYLQRLLLPPEPPRNSGDHGLLHRVGHWFRLLGDAVRTMARRPPAITPLDVFLSEQPRPAWGPWRLHGRMMRFMAGGRSAPWTAPRSPGAGDQAVQWFARYEPADERAAESAARYRSSYVWAFLLAAITLAAAACALAFEGVWRARVAASAVEFLALWLIVALVVADGAVEWQRRAIEYRLLAELCRKQQVLAQLAWAVPRATAWATGQPDSKSTPDATEVAPVSWVSWLFSAWLRDTPLPTGTIDGAWVAQARDAALHDLIEEQIHYHTSRHDQSHWGGKRLVLIGEVLFFIVLFVVWIKLWLLSYGDAAPRSWLVGLGLAGAILPALSAASVGIRAYAELEMLVDQSSAMLAVMKHARGQIKELDPDAPLASQALGSALAAVATRMLEDLEGWERLFRVKVVEA